MTMYARTAYVRPRSVTAALALRAEHPEWTVLAGGTDLMVDRARVEITGVLDLFAVEELHAVRPAAQHLFIGACTTYSELIDSEAVRTRLPLLHAAAADVAGWQVRNRGTIGGNVVSASPVGDMLPGLLALDASIIVASAHETRTVPYEAFIAGFRRVDLHDGELLLGIEIPYPEPAAVQCWRKVGTRRAQAITKVSMAAVAGVTAGRIDQFRLAFGAVADRPVRLYSVEQLALGAAPGAALAEAVRVAVCGELSPITDHRSTADYRREVAADLAGRFVLRLGAGDDARGAP